MRIAFPGVHSAESAGHLLACCLVDGRLAVDAGSLTRTLDWHQQAAIEAVLLTHWHFDHVRDVATLGQNLRGRRSTPLVALPAVHELLAEALLNGTLWSRLYEKPEGEPRWQRVDAQPGHVLDLAGYRLTPWATPHSVPSIGWVIDDGERRVAITGDTGAGFAASLAALGPLDLVVTECTWDDERAAMAAEQGHLCPRTLRDELAALAVVWRGAPRVAVVHRHPEAEAAIVDALAAVPGVWLPAAGEVCQL